MDQTKNTFQFFFNLICGMWYDSYDVTVVHLRLKMAQFEMLGLDERNAVASWRQVRPLLASNASVVPHGGFSNQQLVRQLISVILYSRCQQLDLLS
jgi:hypothetical protein